MALEPVRLEAVRKRYGWRRTPVLCGISLALLPGQVTAVGGRNGSGKSTLLRIVAGAMFPSAGRVTGRPGVVGYVPDRFPSDLRLSPRRYLIHLGTMHGLGKPEAVSVSLELLGRLGFAGDLDAPMTALSKGNAQKVAFAQALAATPGLLVLDEPWTGLDAPSQEALAPLIREAADRGGIVLLSYHGFSGPPGFTAEHHCEMHDGQVRPASLAGQPNRAATDAMLIELTPPGPAGTHLPAQARTMLGPAADLVTSITTAENAVRVAAAYGHSDDILRAALAARWSVRSVIPGTRPESGPSAQSPPSPQEQPGT